MFLKYNIISFLPDEILNKVDYVTDIKKFSIKLVSWKYLLSTTVSLSTQFFLSSTEPFKLSPVM